MTEPYILCFASEQYLVQSNYSTQQRKWKPFGISCYEGVHWELRVLILWSWSSLLHHVLKFLKKCLSKWLQGRCLTPIRSDLLWRNPSPITVFTLWVDEGSSSSLRARHVEGTIHIWRLGEAGSSLTLLLQIPVKWRNPGSTFHDHNGNSQLFRHTW